MASTKISRLITKKNVFLGLIILALLAGAYFAYHKYSQQSVTPTVSVDDKEPKINLDPPTEQELDETAANKEKLSNESQPPPPDTNNFGKTKVTPVITSANQDELRAYVSGVVEDGGTCIATFRQGSTRFTKQSSAFANVNSTNCSVIKLARSDFASSGEWTVVLEYTSNNSTGISQQSTFGVQ